MKGVHILLLEDSGINHTDMQKVVSAGSSVETAGGFPFKTDHGSAMASLISAVAPKSSITVKHVAELAAPVVGVRIINASFGGNASEGFKNTFAGVVGSGALIVKSAGNSQQNLSTDAYTQNCGVLLPLTIFAGNLRQDYKGKTSSGVPGANPTIQNSFLWVVADDVFTASGPNGSSEYSPGTGTSNAAAILSGAAALILSKYPTISTRELKEILLESADRDIFQTYGSGHDAVHVTANPSARESSPLVAYDPTFWGKGALNIKNALLYAELKQRYKTFNPVKLREAMLMLNRLEQEDAAQKIQRAFRSRVKPSQAELEARPSLTVNTRLPSREFEVAPGVPSSPPIAEETDVQRLHSKGVVLPEVPGRKKLKVVAFDVSSSSRDERDGPLPTIAAIPAGVSADLGAFLGADKEHIVTNFKAFFDKELAPILALAPEAAADAIIKKYAALLNPFTANRVIDLGMDYSDSQNPKKTIKSIQGAVTIVDLLHDGLRSSMNEGQFEHGKIAEVTMVLYQKLKAHNLISDATGAGILSILNDFRPYPNPTLTFVADNGLFDKRFTKLEKNWGDGSLQVTPSTGADLINPYEVVEFLKTTGSGQKENLKAFLGTSAGAKLCAGIALQLFSPSFYSKIEHEKYPGDYGAASEAALDLVLGNVQANAPEFYTFLQEYARGNNAANVIAAMREQRGPFENSPSQSAAMMNQLVDACIPLVS